MSDARDTEKNKYLRQARAWVAEAPAHPKTWIDCYRRLLDRYICWLEDLGSKKRPIQKAYNAVCFQRHDNGLSLGVAERDSGYEIAVVSADKSVKRCITVDPTGEIRVSYLQV